jgi:hypothetical protein
MFNNKVLLDPINCARRYQLSSPNSVDDLRWANRRTSRPTNIWREVGTPIITNGEVFCGQHLTKIFEQLISKAYHQSGKSSAGGRKIQQWQERLYSCRGRTIVRFSETNSYEVFCVWNLLCISCLKFGTNIIIITSVET